VGNSIKPEMTQSEASLEQSKPSDVGDSFVESKSDEKAAESVVSTPSVLNRAQRRQASVAPAQPDVVPAVLPSGEAVAVVVEQEAVKAAAPAAPSGPAVYKLGANKSMNSPRGWLADGAEVFLSDFGGDQARVDELVRAEAIVKS
jgi:hypothetical protein